jgi:polar amino acid transport system permease protein
VKTPKQVTDLFIATPDTAIARHIRLINVLILTGLLALLFGFGFSRLSYEFRWEAVWRYRNSMLNGFLMTISISLAALVTSVLLGIFFALARRSRIILLNYFSHVYIEIIRGTPLLVQILIFYYVIANAAGLNNRYVAGVVIMSIFASAYIAEIIRAGIESVGTTQRETARSIGLTKRQTYRHIIFPQVITGVLPPLAGQFASLIKDSSLLSIIAINYSSRHNILTTCT